MATPNDKAWEVIRAYEKKMEAGGLADPYPTHLVLKDYFERQQTGEQSSQLEGSHHYCPNCLAKIDGVTSVHGEPGEDHLPGEGDVSVCIYCTRLLTWKDGAWFGLAREVFDAMPREQQNELVSALVVFSMTDRPGPTSRHIS